MVLYFKALSSLKFQFWWLHGTNLCLYYNCCLYFHSEYFSSSLVQVDSLSKKKQSSESGIPKFEKGLCNVCSTPCLSCSHLKNQPRFCSELKPELSQVLKEEICPSVSQVGDNNMSGCDLTCDPKIESIEGKAGVECGENMKDESLSKLAKPSLVSDEIEEKMTPGTVLADGNEADKMTSKQEDEAIKVDMTDDKCENSKNPSSSGEEKDKTAEAESSDEAEDDVSLLHFLQKYNFLFFE